MATFNKNQYKNSGSRIIVISIVAVIYVSAILYIALQTIIDMMRS